MADWRKLARCHGQTERFFPEQGANAVVAKSLCKVCPVQKSCLAEALVNHEDFGIWGGYNRNERKPMQTILDNSSLRVNLSHLTPTFASDERDTDFRLVV